MSDLETRLHDALEQQARDVLVSGDAWQRNQQLLATSSTQRRLRRLQVAGVAAAAAAVVTLGVVVLPDVGDGNSVAGGGSSSDGQLGRRVVLVNSRLPQGQTFRLSAYLTREGGKGLSLCNSREAVTESGSGDQARGSSVGGGGCTAERPDATFRYLMSEEGGGLHNLVGATGASVTSARAWTTDGRSQPVPLHRLGARGLQAFGFTTTGRQPKVARLVGYDAQGAVVAALDVNEALDGSWLPGGDGCADASTAVPLPDTTTTAKVGATGLLLDQELGGARARSICVQLGDAIAGARDGDGAVVAFAPEAVDVCVRTPTGLETVERAPVVTPTLWRLQVVTPDDLPAGATTLAAVARDGQVLQEVALSDLR